MCKLFVLIVTNSKLILLFWTQLYCCLLHSTDLHFPTLAKWLPLRFFLVVHLAEPLFRVFVHHQTIRELFLNVVWIKTRLLRTSFVTVGYRIPGLLFLLSSWITDILESENQTQKSWPSNWQTILMLFDQNLKQLTIIWDKYRFQACVRRLTEVSCLHITLYVGASILCGLVS